MNNREVVSSVIDEDDSPKIYRTKEYHLFRPMEGNRNVSEKHVSNLVEFISQCNLLKFNPILVTSEYEVADGQHRLEAAKILQVPIYFIIDDKIDYRVTAILNACSDDWEFREYLDLYVKKKYPDYMKIKQFKDEHGLTLKRFQKLMSKEQKRLFDKGFKVGTFVVIDNLEDISNKLKKLRDIISYIESILVIDNKRFIYTDYFWQAIYTFLSRQEVDVERFKEKIGYKCQAIRPLSGIKDYILLFTDIYNWKAKKRLE